MSIKALQEKIGVNPDGDFGPKTLKKAATFFNFSKERSAHFFAQCAHETGMFGSFSENLNYSKTRVIDVFRSDFDTNRDGKVSDTEKTKADQLVGSPEKIANFVYANQNGNGPESSGDGWKYRGRGALQLTGRANYQNFANYLKNQEIMTNPDLVSTVYAFESALYFFDRNKLWSICDKGINDAAIKLLTKRINGGHNGLAHRITMTKKYYQWLS
jgi:putative chitinase